MTITNFGTFAGPAYDLDGVTITGSADIIARGSVGIAGGNRDFTGFTPVLDPGETIIFTFDQPATNVAYGLSLALDSNSNGIFGEVIIEAFGADGNSLGTKDSNVSLASVDGVTDVSAFFGGVSISKFQLTAKDSFPISSLSFSPPSQPPTAVNFINTTTALNENTSTTTRIKVADVTITDDGKGTNNLSLTGADAGAFELDGTVLYLKAGTTLDFETKTSYSVTVNVDDPAVGTTPDASKTFTLQVNDLVENTAPTDLSLSSTTVNENVAVGTTVGSFSTTDAEGGSFTYALVSGTGSTDNASFIIDGNQLKINISPDFETKSSYSIRVETTDASGQAYEEAFTIGINDLIENRTPTAVNDSVNAYRGVPSTIAASTLLANDTDPDAGTTLRITGVSNATNGTVSLNSSGNVVFTATNTGNASFQYTISDGSLTSTATVAVSVGLSLNGGNRIDILKGSDRDDLINGNGGADALYGNNGNDILNGDSGNDLLLGGEGDDLLNGGDSADIFYGGRGNDILTGGSGKDIFAFIAGDGSDTIIDFADGSDKIGLVGLRFSQLTISAMGSNTAIQSGTTTLAILTGVSSNLITAADFVTL